MKINGHGLMFADYILASPGAQVSTFTDSDGATLRIDTLTLVRMYELCKFDLERRNLWASVLERLAENPIA